MACSSPNVIEQRVDPSTGRVVTQFLGSAIYDNPAEYGTIDSLASDGIRRAIVPCGRCVGCRCDYARTWANRMVVELRDNPHAIFLTLTYNDENIPYSPNGERTLSKRDLQLFWKRLRKYFSSKKIRYYVAGEYGGRTQRPHYHAIVYGLDLLDFPDLNYRSHNELKQPFYSSKIMENIWGNGFILMSSVSAQTCAYVARYVLKKHYGDQKADLDDAEPEFSLASRRPGIGLQFAPQMVLSGDTVFPIPTDSGVQDVYINKAMIRSAKSFYKMDAEKLAFIEEFCYNRSVEAHQRLVSSIGFTEVSFAEFLKREDRELSKRLKLLPERGEL